MNRLRILILFIAICSTGPGSAAPALSEAARHAKWKESSIRSIEEVAKKPTWEGVASLYGYFSLAERGEQMEPRHKEVYQLATNTLYSLPDFTNYFRQAIAHYNEEERRWAEDPLGDGDYNAGGDRLRLMYSLQYLPHPEVVGLLASYLDDDFDAYRESRERTGDGYPSNAGCAKGMLDRIGIEDPPKAERRDRLLEREAWRRWAEEVRSGKRTFRFKGDPTEYNFQGPVRKTLDERTRPGRSPGDSNHPGPSSAETGNDAVPSDSTPRPFPWLPVSIAGLILLAAAGFVIRGRPRAGRFRKS